MINVNCYLHLLMHTDKFSAVQKNYLVQLNTQQTQNVACLN